MFNDRYLHAHGAPSLLPRASKVSFSGQASYFMPLYSSSRPQFLVHVIGMFYWFI
jgi:hypothetical protein